MAPTQAPFVLTIYDPKTNEVQETLSRVFIPTGIFSELVEMMQGIDLAHPEKLDASAVDSIYALVVELFGNQIDVDTVRSGTDLLEVLALLTNIMARVGSLLPRDVEPNPTPRAKARRR
jgi:hypothetical protein